MAVGWATVDLERTSPVCRMGGGRARGPSVGATDEPALGARAPWPRRRARLALVILEPSTEGRLAAALARRGEGIACLYVEGATPIAGRLTALGRPGRLLPHDRPWGPFVILLGPAGPGPTDQGSGSP